MHRGHIGAEIAVSLPAKGGLAMSLQSHRPDVWSAGEAYENYVGRWSRPVAHDFIDWLSIPANSRWLDIGCGTGALTETILARAAPASVTGIDPSEGFVGFARQYTQDPRARFEQGNAQALPFSDDAFDAAVAGLVLNFIPDPGKALAEMTRVVRAGGTAAAYVWDYAGEMQLMRYFWDAAVALDPDAQKLDEARRFPICHPDALLALFKNAGFDRSECRSIDVSTAFKDFDDYWSPFLGGQGPAPTYCCALPERQRDALRERLRATLPTEKDGSIRLVARAFAVRGICPA
jgi:SAM-dependent methyltransferase